MKIKFWGTRGSIPTPGNHTYKYGGNSTCVTIDPDGNEFSPLIIDSGTGIRTLSNKLLEAEKPLNLKMIFTHSHWDHIQGFPFFLPAYSPENNIEIYHYPSLGGNIKKSLEIQMDAHNFPIGYDKLKANITFKKFRNNFELMGLHVSILKLNHPGSGVGFRFEKNSKSFVFLTDHELDQQPYNGASLEQTTKFCQNADLLVHDAQYLNSEMELYRGWGHSSAEDVFEMALKAGVKKLALFHHDPNRTDDEIDEILIDLNSNIKSRNLKISCSGAREGDLIDIDTI